VIPGTEFGDRVDEGAAAKTLAGKTPLQPVERSKDPFDRWLLGRGRPRKAAARGKPRSIRPWRETRDCPK
jgi:hypothetical protein